MISGPVEPPKKLSGLPESWARVISGIGLIYYARAFEPGQVPIPALAIIELQLAVRFTINFKWILAELFWP